MTDRKKTPEFKVGMDDIADVIQRMHGDDLLECASLVIVPRAGDASAAGIITWTPEDDEHIEIDEMYHELICAMVWGLMINGSLGPSIIEAVERAVEYFPNVSVIEGRVFDASGVN